MPTIDAIDSIYNISVLGTDGIKTMEDWFVINITEPIPTLNTLSYN